MNKLLFLNGTLPDDFVESGYIIVPLDSFAMRDVIDHGKQYVSIEDYIDYEFALKNKESIWRLFHDFLAACDAALSKHYDLPKIERFGPFVVNALDLRRTIENEILHCRIFDAILKEYCAKEVYYYATERSHRFLGLQSVRFSVHTHDRLLKSLAHRHQVAFRSHIECTRKSNTPAAGQANILAKLKSLVKRNSLYLRSQVWPREQEVDAVAGRAFFMQTGHGSYYYSQFFKDTLRIPDIYSVYNEHRDDVLAAVPAMTADMLMSGLGEIVSSMSRLFDLDVSPIVKNSIEIYLREVPEMLSRALAAERWLNEHNPKYAYFTNCAPDELPFQMALGWRNDVAKVIKRHGDEIYDLTCWRSSDLRSADIYFLETQESADYFQSSADAIGRKVVCVCDAVRMNARRSKATSRRNGVLLYVPWLFDPSLIFDVNDIPSPFFYRVQIEILRALVECSRQRIVYKCLPGGAYNYHGPMPDVIVREFPDIEVSNCPLKRELVRASRCLLDAPSTSMWEAMNAMVPCHSLVWSKSHVRQTAVQYYNKFLTFFDTALEAGTMVRSILDEDRFFVLDDEIAVSQKMKSKDVTALLSSIYLEDKFRSVS